MASGTIEAQDLVSVLAVGPAVASNAANTHLLGAELMGNANLCAAGEVHRHIPEIRQALRNASARDELTISFIPVLVPMGRGILATSLTSLAWGATATSVRETWEAAYAEEPFAHLLLKGVLPRTDDTIGANICLMIAVVDEAWPASSSLRRWTTSPRAPQAPQSSLPTSRSGSPRRPASRRTDSHRNRDHTPGRGVALGVDSRYQEVECTT
ncbi:hypothetical protein GCM10022383_26420 [Microbacterium soli]|uniref:N-acetyl-gamma-glutamyl-phosphate reductase dimerisation domain-containing protein n=1 Tax=Microbacterium soli TaxID=446075 RepID=A0ABP7NHN7_9MICO